MRSILNFAGYSLDMLIMPAGAYRCDYVTANEGLVYAVVLGRVSVQVGDRTRPQRTVKATPGAPVFLVNPGAYHITAEKHSLGVRGVRRG